MSVSTSDPFPTDVAIVGLAGRFPGAPSPSAFWDNLADGVEAITDFADDELRAGGVSPALLADPHYVKRGAVLDRVEHFDAAFFGYAPREAEIMDPQHRLFLECAWEAFEDAGYDPKTYAGRVGVWGGVSANTYLLFNLAPSGVFSSARDAYPLLIGNERDFLATRVSYKLDLTGPSMTVQTACSTSLVAVHLGCQSLLAGECDMALVGGVSVRVPHRSGYLHQEGGILSPDGHCRAFDADGRGTLAGNGVGLVLLKRRADAERDGDHIRALIKGSALNNDGAIKVGYTAPSVDGQAAVIAEALAAAGVPPSTIDYVEAHGTGTPLGDRIEATALGRVLGARRRDRPCAIGSAKTNVGHLDAAAGVTGLIKTVLALEHGRLPPSLNCRQPNPGIDFAAYQLEVNTHLRDWPRNGHPRRAGVSAFGIGGTNAHVVLEEAPPRLRPAGAPAGDGRRQVLVLSAREPAALEAATEHLAAHLREQPDLNLADVAYTLQVGRRAFGQRRALVAHDAADAAAALAARDPQRVVDGAPELTDRPVVLMFPGQGPQYAGMTAGLYADEPVFRAAVDRCAAILEPLLGLDVRQALYPSPAEKDAASARLGEMWLSHGALFTVDYALSQLLLSWGLQVEATIGHSFGEYVAACVAGVFSLEDALAIVCARGRLMQSLPGGAMTSVALAEPALLELLESLAPPDPSLALAASNGPRSCIVAGPLEPLERLERLLAERRIEFRRLPIGHASHSAMMEPIVEPLVAAVRAARLSPPRVPCISNVSGTWLTAAEATDPGYWGRHLRAPVRFAAGLAELLKSGSRLLLEVGPGRTLCSYVRQQDPGVTALACLRHPLEQVDDRAVLLATLGRAWVTGARVDWSAVGADEPRRRVPLPTYPFQRQRFWIDAGPATSEGLQPDQAPREQPMELASVHARPQASGRYVAPATAVEQRVADVWQGLLGIERVGRHDNFFELGGDSLLAVQLITRLEQRLGVSLQLADIVEAQTVEAQAARVAPLRAGTSNGAGAGVLTLAAGGDGRPLVLIHPAGGTVLCYLELARLLGAERPIYAIQSPSLYGAAEPERLEAAATLYLDQLRAIQPHGPYLLGGLSYGGNVAFELCRLLRAAGEEVALLALLDSHPPVAYAGSRSDDISLLRAFPAVLRQYAGQPARLSRTRLERLHPDQRLAALVGSIRRAGVLPAEVDAAGIELLFNAWRTHLLAVQAHRPAALSYPQPTLMFHARQPESPALLRLLGISLPRGIASRGWRPLLGGGPFSVQDVDGSHFTLLHAANVGGLAATLRRCLADVDSEEVAA